MVAAPLNDNKFKWVSSSLNIALSLNKGKSESEKNSYFNILTQDKKYKWVSPRLNVALNFEPVQIQSFANTKCNASQNENQIKPLTITKIQNSTKLEVLNSNDNNQPNSEKVPIQTEHFQCNQCPFIAKKNSTLNRHAREVHKSYCKNCLKIFLGYHKHCKRCSFIGEQPGLVKDHIKKAHKQKVFIVECPTCKKVLKGKSSLSNHTKSHHLGIKYDCDKCPKSFKEKYSLKKPPIIGFSPY